MNENAAKDVTFQEFENKKKKKKEYQIPDTSLKDAAGWALIEAQKWDSASEILHKNERLRSQTCVNALFAIEMYLKSILLNLGINVTTENYGHKIYDMYCQMDNCIKEKLKRNARLDKEVHKSIFNEVLKFNTFEEELKYISNDFMYLRYEYEKFINGKQIIILTDFIMFFKLNCRKIAEQIFYRRMRAERKEKMIKIVEGHNSSSHFWIMPVKIKDMNKNTNDIDNVDEYRKLEISIEEEDVDSYLRPILLEIFNDELPENKKREIDLVHYINPEAYSTFEWYLTYNFFTFEDIEELINRIKRISKLLKNDYNNVELDRIKLNYDWLIYGLAEYDRKREYSIEEKDKMIKENIDLIIDFYERFIKYMEIMKNEGKEKGYNLISFMGP